MPARSMFLSIRVLEVLAQQPPYLALSVREIIERVRDRNLKGEFVETWIWEVMQVPESSVRIPEDDLEYIVERCLRELAGADLVIGEDLKDGGKRWCAVPRWPGRDGGGRNDGREPPSFREGGGDGEDGGGGGIREVLAHPRLFALADEDFEALLDRAIGVEP